MLIYMYTGLQVLDEEASMSVIRNKQNRLYVRTAFFFCAVPLYMHGLGIIRPFVTLMSVFTDHQEVRSSTS